ncbi:hypothetical protein AQUCO_01700728v1 [Aquilegia coerulea]|uniref:Uncharacterized protein n=1 Tax=Aquilegia coerulea TaxID=218851 RepID=A0A2G5DQ54_AQUCA|nr:hypothetical protein AQUCO_01700728v1 [Aquilegia coerulea]
MAGILEYWRENLKRCSDSGDIFEVVDRAIFIAALDHPKEFKNHRDEIIAKLYRIEALLDDLHREKEKVVNAVGSEPKKVDEKSRSSTIDHVDGLHDSVKSDHVVVSNETSKRKIFPIIRMKRVKKMNSQDGWRVTIVPRKTEEGGEEITKCYNGAGDCQRISNGSTQEIPSPVLKEENKNSNKEEIQETSILEIQEPVLKGENKNSNKEVQTSIQEIQAPVLKEENKNSNKEVTTRVLCSDEQAMIQQKIETSKRKLKDGYQAAAKKQHLIRVLDPRDLPKSCAAALHVSQRNHRRPALRRCY